MSHVAATARSSHWTTPAGMPYLGSYQATAPMAPSRRTSTVCGASPANTA
jgi:hypothetical protein